MVEVGVAVAQGKNIRSYTGQRKKSWFAMVSDRGAVGLAVMAWL